MHTIFEADSPTGRRHLKVRVSEAGRPRLTINIRENDDVIGRIIHLSADDSDHLRAALIPDHGDALERIADVLEHQGVMVMRPGDVQDVETHEPLNVMTDHVPLYEETDVTVRAAEIAAEEEAQASRRNAVEVRPGKIRKAFKDALEARVVRFGYTRERDNRHTERAVLPLTLTGTSVGGFDLDRHEFRTFTLNNVDHVHA